MKLASQNGMASADIGADGAKPAEGPKKMQRGDQSKCYADRPRLVPITEMLAIILAVEVARAGNCNISFPTSFARARADKESGDNAALIDLVIHGPLAKPAARIDLSSVHHLDRDSFVDRRVDRQFYSFFLRLRLPYYMILSDIVARGGNCDSEISGS